MLLRAVCDLRPLRESLGRLPVSVELRTEPRPWLMMYAGSGFPPLTVVSFPQRQSSPEGGVGVGVESILMLWPNTGERAPLTQESEFHIFRLTASNITK